MLKFIKIKYPRSLPTAILIADRGELDRQFESHVICATD